LNSKINHGYNTIRTGNVNIKLITNFNTMVGWFIVFNATFNNISVISWRSVLFVEETGVLGENYLPVASH
jgi:hypothetical protein